MPTSGLEHPFLRLLQVLVLLAAILYGLNELNLLTPPEPQVTVTRITGDDPISVAASAAREAHGSAETVILVGVESLADGVVATGLAGAVDAPILLNELSRMSPQTLDVIRELDATRAIMIGGTGSMRGIVERTLSVTLELDTTRIAGASRFDTADLVAREFADDADVGVVDGQPTAVVVPADDVAAGLAAGGLAAARTAPMPVLYSQEGILPTPTTNALSRLGIAQIFAAEPVEEFDGRVITLADPVDVADTASALRGFQPTRIVVVPDDDEARALIGGPVAGQDSGVILPFSDAEGWLIDNCGTLTEIFIIADVDVITDTDVDRLERAATVCEE